MEDSQCVTSNPIFQVQTAEPRQFTELLLLCCLCRFSNKTEVVFLVFRDGSPGWEESVQHDEPHGDRGGRGYQVEDSMRCKCNLDLSRKFLSKKIFIAFNTSGIYQSSNYSYEGQDYPHCPVS